MNLQLLKFGVGTGLTEQPHGRRPVEALEDLEPRGLHSLQVRFLGCNHESRVHEEARLAGRV
jgi:hypothetical protein